ncbi:MAG: hypothetical protein QF580_01880 [Gammaproteobacteria bacterium]|nr:hypothetical protein [Gammaproteobacteria bacterium]
MVTRHVEIIPGHDVGDPGGAGELSKFLQLRLINPGISMPGAAHCLKAA